VAWRGVAWRGVAWRGVAEYRFESSHITFQQQHANVVVVVLLVLLVLVLLVHITIHCIWRMANGLKQHYFITRYEIDVAEAWNQQWRGVD